jgi:hypothetical protein
MTTLAGLLADDPEWRQFHTDDANIDQAERGYRSDPALVADFERTRWFPERAEAARHGETMWSKGREQAPPALQFTPQPGQLQVHLSPWAGFAGLREEVQQRRRQLIDHKRPQLLEAVADREAELRSRVLDARVRDVAALVAEANELLALTAQLRGPVPRTIRTTSGLAPARYRERTDEIELHDAATGGWSLLDPLPHDEPTSLATATYGVQRDDRPSVAEGRDRAVRYGTHRSAG